MTICFGFGPPPFTLIVDAHGSTGVPPSLLESRGPRQRICGSERVGRVETRVVAEVGLRRHARRRGFASPHAPRLVPRHSPSAGRNHCLRARPGESVRRSHDPLAPQGRHAVPEQRGTSAEVRSTRVVARPPRRARRGSCRARRRPPDETTATTRVERAPRPSLMLETVAAECRGRQFWPRGGVPPWPWLRKRIYDVVVVGRRQFAE